MQLHNCPYHNTPPPLSLGKTVTSLQLVCRLFHVWGHGAQTDTWKHLEAAYRVLAPLTQAATEGSSTSSRMGLYTECQVDSVTHSLLNRLLASARHM